MIFNMMENNITYKLGTTKFYYFSLVYTGKVNSLLGVCESLMPLIYGPMYSSIYAATMKTFPGTFFIVGACMTMPAVAAFL